MEAVVVEERPGIGHDAAAAVSLQLVRSRTQQEPTPLPTLFITVARLFRHGPTSSATISDVQLCAAPCSVEVGV
ncbi:hypothetical protein JYU34_007001 [Plutella xylostella]|uniref:Uncharacterized protein n=1 Tax=Plutella xylostella TaxID=51655 RepID=A0ABQ7QPD1_PLUXY|nr:hypothetical protein JYU34_007001 [Plutella xylostella]